MKKSILLLKLSLPLILLAVLASGVAATAEFIYRDSYEALCNIEDPGRVWMAGENLQIRGQINRNRTYSPDSDMHTGTNIATINATLDVNTGNGTAKGTVKSMPDAYDGAWEGTFSGRLIGGLYSGRGVAHGTGELSGMQMKTVSRPIPYDPLLMPPGSCSPYPDPPTLIHNEIRVLIPNGN